MSEMSSRHFVWILLALAFFVTFFEIGRRDVVDANEAQRAAPPAEMLRRGDFIIPTINEEDYLNKPPLVYWMIAGVYALTGVISPVTARIPTGISFLVLILSVYAYARRTLGESAARWSALALMTSPYLVERARYAELDMPLTLAIFLAVIALWKACDSRSAGGKTLFVFFSGVAFGAAILLKGPVPFLFLGPAWIACLVAANPENGGWIARAAAWTCAAFGIGIVLWLLGLVAPGITRSVRFPAALLVMFGVWLVFAWRHGQPERLRSLILFSSVMAIGIAVAAPWGIAVLARKGWPYIETLLRTEALERTHVATRINSGSPFYYLLGLAAMVAPWSLLLPCQISSQWKNAAPAYRRSLFTGWLSILVFSLIAGKEYEYIMPAVPFLMIVLGKQLDDAAAKVHAGWTVRWCERWRDSMPWLLSLLAVVFLILTIRAAPEGSTRLIIEAAVLTIVVVALASYSLRNPGYRFAMIPLMAVCAVMLWYFSQDYRYSGQRSVKPIAIMAGDLVRAGYRVGVMEPQPAFAFYAGVRVAPVRNQEELLRALDAPDPCYCVVPAEVARNLSPPLPAIVVAPLFGPNGKTKLILIGNRPLPHFKDKSR